MIKPNEKAKELKPKKTAKRLPRVSPQVKKGNKNIGQGRAMEGKKKRMLRAY